MTAPDLYAAESAASGLVRCLDEAIRHSLQGDARREQHDVNLAIGYLQEAAEAMGFQLREKLPPGVAELRVNVSNAPVACADCTPITAAQVAAFFDGASPCEVLAMAA